MQATAGHNSSCPPTHRQCLSVVGVPSGLEEVKLAAQGLHLLSGPPHTRMQSGHVPGAVLAGFNACSGQLGAKNNHWI